MRRFSIATALLAASLCALSLIHCGDDDGFLGDLGAPCRDDRDCDVTSRCEHRGEGGECLWECRDQRDCPPGWACVDSHGTTCHPLCDSDRDCYVGFECKKKKNHGSGGDSRVCEP